MIADPRGPLLVNLNGASSQLRSTLAVRCNEPSLERRSRPYPAGIKDCRPLDRVASPISSSQHPEALLRGKVQQTENYSPGLDYDSRAGRLPGGTMSRAARLNWRTEIATVSSAPSWHPGAGGLTSAGCASEPSPFYVPHLRPVLRHPGPRPLGAAPNTGFWRSGRSTCRRRLDRRISPGGIGANELDTTDD